MTHEHRAPTQRDRTRTAEARQRTLARRDDRRRKAWETGR